MMTAVINVQRNVQGMIVKINVIGNYLDSILLTEWRQGSGEKMHMMLQNRKMVVLTVLDNTLIIIIRLVILFFFVSNIIGIIWYVSTISNFKLLIGITYSLILLLVELFPTKIFLGKISNIIFTLTCRVGIVLTLFSFQITGQSNDLFGYLTQSAIIACFLYLIIRRKMFIMKAGTDHN